MRRIIPVIALAILAACSQDNRSYVPDMTPLTPTMATSDVLTFISDSGYTKYKIVAPLWLMFDDCDEPFWQFPRGLSLEQYNMEMEPVANVDCDSAVYLYRQRLWRLDGDVVMVNVDRDSFLTQQLFWDQTERKIYSDSFIHIVRADRIIEGFGFESEENMRSYTVNNPTAILPARLRKAKSGEAGDSLVAPADTLTLQ